MQKHVNLVDLVKSFPTNIYLQNLASIQKRTSPVKFAHFAEKSGKRSISNLSTQVQAAQGKLHDRLRVPTGEREPLVLLRNLAARGVLEEAVLRPDHIVDVVASLVLWALCET